MGMRIKTNAASARALREMGQQTGALKSSTTKLASGKRINQAADDAAGLSISENLRAKVRGVGQARRNALDGLSVLEVAEGGFVETTNMLVRLRELAVQASSDTVGNNERNYLDREFVALKQEIDRIAASVEFNGVRLLGGQPTPPGNSFEKIPTRKLDYPMEFQVDTQYFEKADGLSSKSPVNVIRFTTKNLVAYTTGDHSLNLGEGYEGTRVNSKNSAHHTLNLIDKAITRVNEHRAFVGSTQNRLKHLMTNLSVKIENMKMSNSRISDTDFAAETATYVQSQVGQRAASSVLSQANVLPEVALSLLERGRFGQNITPSTIIQKNLR
jgi:flagellin